jgi:hypothetical protein
MTSDEMLALDEIVCRGLRKKPGQTVEARAKELMFVAKTPELRKACRILGYGSGEPWGRMQKAADLLIGRAKP